MAQERYGSDRRESSGAVNKRGIEDPVIRGRGLEKTYGSKLPFTRTVEVLQGVDIDLASGEIVGIAGENGSGKSTLMKILVGVLDHDAGEIQQRGTIGWCPQDIRLYDRLTVEETFELFGQAYDMSDSDIEKAKREYGDELDFGRFFDYQVRHLSGGNRQKVNLSVALMHDPDVLLLDEPYTGFDWETYQAFWDLTDELVDDGVGIVIISHFINEHSRFDGIYELQNGQLYWNSDPDDE